MTNEELLAQIDSLRTCLLNNMKDEYFEDEDGCVEQITEGDDELLLKAKGGYSSHVDVLASAKDTGNGFIFHFPSYSCATQDNYICMGYDEAEYIRKLLTYQHKHDTTRS